MAQLEGGGLKAEVGPRADLQDEPEVNVHQPALGVDQDVAVVAVLGLQEEAGDGIPAGRCEQPSECSFSCTQWSGCAGAVIGLQEEAGTGAERPAEGTFLDMQQRDLCEPQLTQGTPCTLNTATSFLCKGWVVGCAQSDLRPLCALLSPQKLQTA